jgi:hypothetical protein
VVPGVPARYSGGHPPAPPSDVWSTPGSSRIGPPPWNPGRRPGGTGGISYSRRWTRGQQESPRRAPHLSPRVSAIRTPARIGEDVTGSRSGLFSAGRIHQALDARANGRGHHSRRSPRPCTQPPAARGSALPGLRSGNAGRSAPPGRPRWPGPRGGARHRTAGARRVRGATQACPPSPNRRVPSPRAAQGLAGED